MRKNVGGFAFLKTKKERSKASADDAGRVSGRRNSSTPSRRRSERNAEKRLRNFFLGKRDRHCSRVDVGLYDYGEDDVASVFEGFYLCRDQRRKAERRRLSIG